MKTTMEKISSSQADANSMQTLFESLEKIAESFIEEHFQKFRGHHINRLNSFNTIIDNACIAAKEIPETDDAVLQLWLSVEACLAELNKWADFHDYQGFMEKALIDCRQCIEPVISGIPKHQVEVWNETFYLSTEEHSFITILFKRVKRIKRWWRIRFVSGMNYFRAYKREIRKESHLLMTQQFVIFYFQNPFIQFTTTVTNRLLGLVSEQLNELHHKTQNYMTEILMTDKEEADWITGHHDKLKTRLLAAGERITLQEAWDNALNTCHNEIISSFKLWKEPLQKEFIRNSQYTGTWVLPHYQYGQVKSKHQERQQQTIHKRHQALWEEHFQGEEWDWSHEFALNKRQLIVIRRTTETLGIISGKIRSQIIPKCADAIVLLVKTHERIDNLKTDQDWELKKNMVRESRTLLMTFRHEMIPAIASRFLGAGIGKDLSQIIVHTQESVDQLSDFHTVFKHRDTRIPPHSELSKIPIKDLFREELLVKLQSVLDVFEHQLRVRLDEIVNAMSDIRQSVEFNIETSLGLLEKEDYTDEAFHMVLDGIQRSTSQLAAIKERVEAIPAEITNELGKIAFQWLIHIQGLLDNEKLIALKLTLTKVRASSRLKAIGTAIKERTLKMIAALTSSLKQYHEKCRETYLQIQSYLGFSIPEDDIQVQFTQFLLETQQTLDSLPFVYQQLFQIEPLTDSRLFFGRDEDIKSLKEDIDTWEKTGSNMLTAVVGEKGSGKTTVINLFEQAVPKKYPVRICSFEETVHSTEELLTAFTALSPEKPFDSMEALEMYLIDRSTPMILIVENIHNFFIKSMEGFDLLEDFLGLIHRTRKQVLWVCSCALYSWEYLDKSLKISRVFSRVIMLKPFTGDQIESMILARHRMTGYQLKFKASKKTALSRKFRKLTSQQDRQTYLKRDFFGQIQDVASGNISVAILFWLRSIRSILEHELQIASQVKFNVKFLAALTPEDLFTLGAVAQHETISSEDHALIFRQSPGKSFLTLNTLTRMGILQQYKEHYRIHPFLYRHVIRSLKLQNILH